MAIVLPSSCGRFRTLVSEPFNSSLVSISENEESNFLIGYGLFNPVSMITGFVMIAAFAQRHERRED